MAIDTLARKENQRREALARGDQLKYFRLCNELEIGEIENILFYEHGEAESRHLEDERENLEELLDAYGLMEKYQLFVRESDKQGINIFNLGRNTAQKKKLLSRHFPVRFGKNGIQDLKGYSDAEIGAIYKHLLEYSRKKIEGQ